MAIYASGTTVSVEKSRAEIETILNRYGAKSFAYGRDQEKAMIQFECHDRFIRFTLPLPNRKSKEFTHAERRGFLYMRTSSQADAAWEQACRERWRSLTLAIKAKLEAVRCGISEFEDEFMAYVVMPNGQTLSEVIRPKIAEAYATNDMPKLLGLPGPRA